MTCARMYSYPRDPFFVMGFVITLVLLVFVVQFGQFKRAVGMGERAAV